MIWDATTPIYLPLVFPDCVLAAAHRLTRDVEAVFGCRPPLKHQPAPFGEAALLLAPDPAYTAALAPETPETFVVQTNRWELVVTGGDAFGTVLGLAWLRREMLGIPPLAESIVPRGQGLDLPALNFEQPPWPEAERAWVVDGRELAAGDRLWAVGEALIHCGGNTLACVGERPAEVVEMAQTLGLRCVLSEGPALPLDTLREGAPRWW